jgi:release factor glutamine methyltransferase
MPNPPITVFEMIQKFRKELKDLYDEKEIMQFLHLLFRYRIGWSKADIHINKDPTLQDEVALYFNEACTRLSQNEPVQYIIGITEFLGSELIVNPSVMIPRPETEELVTRMITDLKNKIHSSLSLLDIGTGSGCIAIALKKEFPKMTVYGCDSSQEAVTVASRNATGNNCDITFYRSDILEPASWDQLPLVDIIVSNPPYITGSEKQFMKQNVLVYEPHLALFVQDNDPLKYYKAIALFALSHLVKHGTLYFEINERFGSEVKILLQQSGFQNTEIFKDMNGKDRFARSIS